MGTLAEEIISRKVGRAVKAGEIVLIDVDKIMSHDTTSMLAIEAMKKLADMPKYPEKITIVFDHVVPPASIDQARAQRKIMEFIEKHNIANFFQEGVCHQVMIEKGLVLPGNVIIGADSHSCSYGAMGAFGTGMGSTDIGIAYATGKTWLRVPESILIKVSGRFAKGVYAKDLILTIIKTVGVDGAIYKALEFTGETVKNMSVSERITLSNMAIECGAKVGLIGSDDKTTVYLKKRTDETGDAIAANNGCYDRVMEFEVENLVPQVACPHDLDNLCPIDKVEDIGIHEVFIGTCTNGRYEDLKVAADILKGHKVSRFTRTIIIPASVSIYQEAMQSGVIKTFQDAGCIVCNPGCGPCIGRSQGTLAAGERALTTMNRNFRGRMGSPDSEIYIASPATCAASAIEGKIADPRKYL